MLLESVSFEQGKVESEREQAGILILRGHQFPRRLRQPACPSEPLGSAAGRSLVSSSKSKITLDLALAGASVHADEKSKMSLKDLIQSEDGGAHLQEWRSAQHSPTLWSSYSRSQRPIEASGPRMGSDVVDISEFTEADRALNFGKVPVQVDLHKNVRWIVRTSKW
jgi:hypothetical protein